MAKGVEYCPDTDQKNMPLPEQRQYQPTPEEIKEEIDSVGLSQYMHDWVAVYQLVVPELPGDADNETLNNYLKLVDGKLEEVAAVEAKYADLPDVEKEGIIFGMFSRRVQNKKSELLVVKNKIDEMLKPEQKFEYTERELNTLVQVAVEEAVKPLIEQIEDLKRQLAEAQAAQPISVTAAETFPPKINDEVTATFDDDEADEIPSAEEDDDDDLEDTAEEAKPTQAAAEQVDVTSKETIFKPQAKIPADQQKLESRLNLLETDPSNKSAWESAYYLADDATKAQILSLLAELSTLQDHVGKAADIVLSRLKPAKTEASSPAENPEFDKHAKVLETSNEPMERWFSLVELKKMAKEKGPTSTEARRLARVVEDIKKKALILPPRFMAEVALAGDGGERNNILKALVKMAGEDNNDGVAAELALSRLAHEGIVYTPEFTQEEGETVVELFKKAEADAKTADKDPAARDRALKLFQEIVKKDPDNGLAWEFIANLSEAAKDEKTAKHALEQVLLIYPDKTNQHHLNALTRIGLFGKTTTAESKKPNTRAGGWGSRIVSMVSRAVGQNEDKGTPAKPGSEASATTHSELPAEKEDKEVEIPTTPSHVDEHNEQPAEPLESKGTPQRVVLQEAQPTGTSAESLARTLNLDMTEIRSIPRLPFSGDIIILQDLLNNDAPKKALMKKLETVKGIIKMIDGGDKDLIPLIEKYIAKTSNLI